MTNTARRLTLAPLSASILVSIFSAIAMPVVDAQYFKLIAAFVLAIGLLIFTGRKLLWLSIILAIAWQQIALDHSMWTLGSAMVTLLLWSNAISLLDGKTAETPNLRQGTTRAPRLGFLVSMLSFGCLTSFSALLHIEDPIWRSGEIGESLLTANYLSRFPNLFLQIFGLPIVPTLSALTSWALLSAFMVAPILALFAYRYVAFFYLWLTIFGLFIVSSLAFLRLGRLPWVEMSVLSFWILEGKERFQLPTNNRFRFKRTQALSSPTCARGLGPKHDHPPCYDGKKNRESRIGIRFALVAISFLSGSSLLLSSNYSAVGIPEPQSLARMIPGMAWRGGRPVYFAGIGPINVFNSDDLHMDLRWRTFELVDGDKSIHVPLNETNGERGKWLFHDTLYFGNDLQWRREANLSPENCLIWLDGDHRLNRPIISLIAKKYRITDKSEIRISAWSRPELGIRDYTLECQLVVSPGGE